MLKYVVCLCKGCDGCCVCCLYCEACSSRCLCMGSDSVSSCRCCMFVSCVHLVAVMNAAFFVTCSLLMLVEHARGDHMKRTMLANFHVWGIMVLLRTVLNILVRNVSPRGHMCFRCLIFNLSGPTLWIVIFTLFYSFLDMRSSECDVVSVYVVCCSVNGSVCFVCFVFDGVFELIGETICNMFGCVCYFVVECDGVVVCGWRFSIW